MTVKEFIKMLSAYPDDARVGVETTNGRIGHEMGRWVPCTGVYDALGTVPEIVEDRRGPDDVVRLDLWFADQRGYASSKYCSVDRSEWEADEALGFDCETKQEDEPV